MQSQKRWGILTLAVVMFFVTLIVGSIASGRNANPLYLFVWIMVGWYAYKGDLKSIMSWMKILIWLAVVGVGLIYLFVGDNSSIGMSVKHDMAIGVAIMLIPKIGLFYYCKSQLDDISISPSNAHTAMNKSSNTESTPKTYQSFFNVPDLTASAQASPLPVKHVGNAMTKTENTKNNISEPLAEDWEKALNEYENENRIKGLWAKLFADNNGDENIVKAQYIKFRAVEIAAARRKEIEDRRSNIYSHASNEDCIRNGAMNQFQANIKFPVYKLGNGNYAIYVSWRYKIYSSLDSLNKTIIMFNDTELFSRDGFIEDIASK